MPNNNKTTWVCSDCEVNLASPTTCSSYDNSATTSDSIHDLSSVRLTHNNATAESTSRIGINSPTTCPSTYTTKRMTNNTPCLSDDGKVLLNLKVTMMTS